MRPRPIEALFAAAIQAQEPWAHVVEEEPEDVLLSPVSSATPSPRCTPLSTPGASPSTWAAALPAPGAPLDGLLSSLPYLSLSHTHARISPPSKLPRFVVCFPAVGKVTDRQKAGKRARRSKKRAQAGASHCPFAFKIRSSLSEKWSQPFAARIQYSVAQLTAARGAFVGLRRPPATKACPQLAVLVGRGFRVIEWDGRCVFCFCWRPIANGSNRAESAVVDGSDGLFIALTGRPKGVSDWDRAIGDMTEAMLEAGRELEECERPSEHRRGRHLTIGDGASFGGGRKVSSFAERRNPLLTASWYSALGTSTFRPPGGGLRIA